VRTRGGRLHNRALEVAGRTLASLPRYSRPTFGKRCWTTDGKERETRGADGARWAGFPRISGDVRLHRVGFELERTCLSDNGDLKHYLKKGGQQVGLPKGAETALLFSLTNYSTSRKPSVLAVLITGECTGEEKAKADGRTVGAGFPQLRGQMGNAKSYARGLFDFPLPTVGGAE